MKNIFSLVIGCFFLSSLFGQDSQELLAKKKQFLAQIDTDFNDLYLGIEPKDEFDTFKEYLQQVFKAVPAHYDDQYQKLNEIYYGELKNIDMKLDDLLDQGKQSSTIVVTLHRYIAERSIYSMDISIENIALGSIEAEIEREDAKQLKRNWDNVQKVGYLKADGSGNFIPSHFQLTNPATGYVFTHFFDIPVATTEQTGGLIEKVQVVKVPFYAIRAGEKVQHLNESLMYMENDGTFYLQINRTGEIYNIIDGIEYGPYEKASCPKFIEGGWSFHCRKDESYYKISYDMLGATEQQIDHRSVRHLDGIVIRQKLEINSLPKNRIRFFKGASYEEKFKVEFADGREYYRTGAVSASPYYKDWALGVSEKAWWRTETDSGLDLVTSYGTFKDAWNIGFIELNGRVYYCFGTLEGQTITLNFPMKYSID
jgi:hypothetical protein